jgi:hypothetical protein
MSTNILLGLISSIQKLISNQSTNLGLLLLDLIDYSADPAYAQTFRD